MVAYLEFQPEENCKTSNDHCTIKRNFGNVKILKLKNKQTTTYNKNLSFLSLASHLCREYQEINF